LEWIGLPERESLAEVAEVHGRAVELMQRAIADTDADDPTWVNRAAILPGAYADAIDGRFPGLDVARSLDFGEDVMRAE
jgi:hypothetical protein